MCKNETKNCWDLSQNSVLLLSISFFLCIHVLNVSLTMYMYWKWSYHRSQNYILARIIKITLTIKDKAFSGSIKESKLLTENTQSVTGSWWYCKPGTHLAWLNCNFPQTVVGIQPSDCCSSVNPCFVSFSSRLFCICCLTSVKTLESWETKAYFENAQKWGKIEGLKRLEHGDVWKFSLSRETFTGN